MCDAGELDVLAYGQVDHLACCPGRSRQPAQCRPFIAAPEPEVEHDTDPQPQGLQRDRDEPPFEHEALAVGQRIAEQRDHSVIRGQPRRRARRGEFFGPDGFGNTRATAGHLGSVN